MAIQDISRRRNPSSITIPEMGSTLAMRRTTYHAHTLWLFTVNDLKTMVLPSLIFALSLGYASASLSIDHSPHGIAASQLVSRVPLAILWTWINLLVFTLDNQKQSHSIEEDRLNKPWRPLPAGRLTQAQAHAVSAMTRPVALIISMAVTGGTLECLLLMALGHIYNKAQGDSHWLRRNLLNAGGFTSFASGTLKALVQSSTNNKTLGWLFVIGCVVSTTVHIQDMYDQEGDSAAGRRTIPLVFGDAPARYSIILAVGCWSVVCPWFWRSTSTGYVLSVLSGLCVMVRCFTKRSVGADRVTFLYYNLWLAILYTLPLSSS